MISYRHIKDAITARGQAGDIDGETVEKLVYLASIDPGVSDDEGASTDPEVVDAFVEGLIDAGS